MNMYVTFPYFLLSVDVVHMKLFVAIYIYIILFNYFIKTN